MSSKKELWSVDIGRFSTSMAWYPDSNWAVMPLSYGRGKCTRWRIDFGRLGWRIEWYGQR